MLPADDGLRHMTEQVLDSDFDVNRGDATGEPPLRGWQAGDLLVDLPLRRLSRGGTRVAVQETPFRLLCLLLQRGGRPLSRRELHRILWSRFDWDSGERSLNTAVRKLRRAIGDDAREPRLIETLRTSGYRWIGPEPQPLGASLPATPPLLAGAPAVRPRPWKIPVAASLLAATLAAVWLIPSREPSWIVFDEPRPESAQARLLETSLRSLLAAEMPADAGEPVRLTIALRGAEPVSAEVSGRGALREVHLDEPFGAERLAAEIAGRLPTAAVRTKRPELPASAQSAYAEAVSVMGGAATEPALSRAAALLEGVLSASPDHSGALRAYARAERWLALLGRDPAAARDRRLLAREALRRAIRAEPRSGAVAADVAAHLVWGEWTAAAASNWFALARSEAPDDPAILRGYAWFALANDQSAAALDAMNDALALAPLDTDLHADLGWFYFRTGRYDDALRQCRAAIQIGAKNESAQTCEERALAEQGHFDAAWQALRRHAPAWLDERRARELDALDPEVAYRAAMHLAARDIRERLGPGYASACLEAIAGDREAATADLDAAVALADPGLHLSRVTPELVRMLGLLAAGKLAEAELAPLVGDDRS